jgi:hypothetical protein
MESIRLEISGGAGLVEPAPRRIAHFRASRRGGSHPVEMVILLSFGSPRNAHKGQSLDTAKRMNTNARNPIPTT